MISKLIQLLDAATESPASTSIQLHDYSGELIKTLQIWASVHQLRVDHRVLTGSGSSSDVFTVELANNVSINVHDHQSVRASKDEPLVDMTDDSMWSPV